jgi:hypothetical protein
MDSSFVDEEGLHIRFNASGLKGYKMLRRIAEAVQRPVDTFGSSFKDEETFLWIIAPLTKIDKGIGFGNQPPKRKK